MRLVDTASSQIQEFRDHEIEKYAILSHTWGEEEKKGFKKIKESCSLAKKEGFEFIWIDTCCIDKTSSAELSEAINSMYRWYQEADVCYAYLADVTRRSQLSRSRWFTRGWTLQELIAPSRLEFLDQNWEKLGTKEELRQTVSECTGIPVGILSGSDDLESISIAQRMSWAARRETSRIEDRAYCLLGIFRINMPLIYGERETAFIRLQEEIMKISADHSLFAWKSDDSRGGLLATSPAAYIDSSDIVQYNPFDASNSPLTLSSKGIYLEIRFIGIGPQGVGLAILHCKDRGGEDRPIAIYVQDIFLTMDEFDRVGTRKFEQIDSEKKRHMMRAQKSGQLQKLDVAALEKYYDGAHLVKSGEGNALLKAVDDGLEGDVWLLLTRSDVEATLKDRVGRTALTNAVIGGREAIVKMLLSRSDVKADLEDEDGRTLLSLAAQSGHDAVVKSLLKSGKVDTESKDKTGRTPLSWAAESGHEAVVRLLLESGSSVDSDHTDGRKPLSWAAANGHEAVVQLLLDSGANIKLEDANGCTPLSWTARELGRRRT
ncbi:ankyrin repeat-containing domain protein [Phaeosphaeriaceae sp. PMI808]|nr:ankyrin repeat-containing domain protein [Phaeosphaeriaceae sp. PMI808]